MMSSKYTSNSVTSSSSSSSLSSLDSSSSIHTSIKNSSIISGSDLAPFVAVIPIDRTLDDIQNDIDLLNEPLDERLLVQITGRDGTPVHYEGSMKNGSPVELDENGDGWFVQVDDNDIVLPLNSISGLEIWMDDIQNDIDLLNELLDERLLVQITGRDGTPVHYEGSMKNGSPVELDEDGDGWFVQVDDNDVVLPLNSISGLEIWMGGIFLHRFVSNRVGLTHNGGFDQAATIKLPQMAQIGVMPTSEIGANDPLLGVMATFGPILYADYQRLPREMAMSELMLLSRNGTARDLMIQGFGFRKSKIRGIISILEKLGISTTKSDTTREIATGIHNEDDNGDGRHEQQRLR